MENNCAFVFAVCGAAEHIETLNFSIVPLLKRTKYKVYVVTDLSRNEGTIKCDNIIDVKTPEDFNNHQASIFLKTSLHKFLPSNVNYCYLDSDVLAIGNYVDEIFNEFVPPIRFGLDHCTANRFSLSAINCSCKKDFEYHQQNILRHADEFSNSTNEKVIALRREIDFFFKSLKKNIPLRIKYFLLFLIPAKKIKLNDKFFYYPNDKVFKDLDGLAFMRVYKLSRIVKQLGYKWNYLKREPLLQNGYCVWREECLHLHEEIKNKFNIDVTNKKFKHYNGGVFLFNNTSHAFLDYWHAITMEIFKDERWKTRDQGTLIATTWKFKMQKSKPLNNRWNLILDYNDAQLNFNKILQAHHQNDKKKAPQFLHVYHHFADRNWHVWNTIEEML